MTLRTSDWIKVLAKESIDDGLKEIVKTPELQISGPFSKIRWPLGEPNLPMVHEEIYASQFDPWMQPDPVIYSVPGENEPRGVIRYTLPTGGALSTLHGGLEYLVGFHTPRDRRPRSYLPLEEAESRALLAWERRKSRLMAKLSTQTASAVSNAIARTNRRIQKLVARQRAALRKGQTDKVARLQRKIDVLRLELREPRSRALWKLFTRVQAVASDFGKDVYIMRRMDLLRQSAAERWSRWLAQPRTPLVMLPVNHFRIRQGYADLSFEGHCRYFAHSDPDEPGVTETLKQRLSLDHLFAVPSNTKITGYSINVDESKLASAIADATSNEFAGITKNFIVDFVELRDVVSSILEIPKVCEAFERAFKQTVGRRYGRALSAGLVTLEGLWSAFRFLSSRDLCYKFGTKDTLRFFKDFFGGIQHRLGDALRPFVTLLRENCKVRSVHRVIDRSTTQTVHEYPMASLLVGDAPEWVQSLHLLSEIRPESKVRVTTTEVVEQRLTLQLVSRLENELGVAVGESEGLTRYFMSLLGLDKWLGAAWDLTPFTFVIDWFVDIGSFLEQFRIGGLHVAYDLFGGCISEIRNVTSVVSLVHPRENWGDVNSSNGSYVVSLSTRPLVARCYKRNLLSNESLVRYAPVFVKSGIRLGRLNAWQALTGAELIATRGPSNLSNLAKSIRRIKRLWS